MIGPPALQKQNANTSLICEAYKFQTDNLEQDSYILIEFRSFLQNNVTSETHYLV